MFDFHALKEALAAVNAVGNAGLQQGFFKLVRLGVGAVKYGHLRGQLAAVEPGLNAPGNKARFVHFVESRVDAQRLALGRSEEHTSELQSIMRISYAVF